MPNFELFQINISAVESQMYNDGEDVPRVDAWRDCLMGWYKRGLEGGFYEHVATIEAVDLDHVFEVGNIGPESRINRLAKMHSVSVGDLIKDPDNKMWVVASIGFEEVV